MHNQGFQIKYAMSSRQKGPAETSKNFSELVTGGLLKAVRLSYQEYCDTTAEIKKKKHNSMCHYFIRTIS